MSDGPDKASLLAGLALDQPTTKVGGRGDEEPVMSIFRMNRWPTLLAATLVVLAAIGPPPTSATGPNSVLVWNLHAVEALANPPTAATPGAGQTPPVVSLHLAMVQGAVYDAVNAIEGGHRPYLAGLPAASPGASKRAAVAAAAHDVLVGLVPPLPQVVRDRLDALYAASLGGIPDGAAKDSGIAVGAAAAAAMLAERANDGRYGSFSFSPGTEPGQWRPTSGVNDPFAWVARVRPFALQSQSQFRTAGPRDLTSVEYAAEYAEVKALGSATSTSRTAAQTAVALFYTENPLVLWNRTFRVIAQDRSLSVVDSARLFAMLGVAGADAVIGCWDDKAHWSFWRPVTAIRLGDTDGNRATDPQSDWTPLGPTPPYPDHPSGYNCHTGAVVHTAKRFFGTDRVSFTVHSNATNVDRSYARFSDAARDTIDARVFLGIHFRSPDVQGARLGMKVAGWVDKHHFQPVE